MATFETLENKKVKLTIEIGAEEFDGAIARAYQKTKGKYNVPGFRKGKAPKRMIENMYGEGVFLEDAFESVYADAYDKAVEELKLEPVERPGIDITTIGQGEGVVFTAEFAVRPEVQLGLYKGIEVLKRAYTVEDAEIDRLIEQEREKVARYVEQERPVEQNDRVLLDYAGSIDGVPFDGGAAEDAELVIGSNTFIPGFEEQLVGMAKEEERDITVTFPEEYHAEALKGKAAVFHVKIKGIQVKELPELDDEFAQDVSEFDTLEELRQDKRASMEKRNVERAKNEMENEAILKATENAEFDVPEAMIRRQSEYMLQELNYRLQMSGLDLATYCKYIGKDVQALLDEQAEEAERRVRTQLVLDAIGKAESLEATDEDIEREIVELAGQAGKEPEEYKSGLTAEDMEYFKDRAGAQKIIDFLMEHAKMTDAPKKPKKPAAKKKPKEDGAAAEAEKPVKKPKAAPKKKQPVEESDGKEASEKGENEKREENNTPEL